MSESGEGPPPADGVPRVTCTASFTLATFYLVIGVLLIIIPWAFPTLFTLAAAFIIDVMGVLLFVAALAHIYYISRVVATKRRCECP